MRKQKNSNKKHFSYSKLEYPKRRNFAKIANFKNRLTKKWQKNDKPIAFPKQKVYIISVDQKQQNL